MLGSAWNPTASGIRPDGKDLALHVPRIAVTAQPRAPGNSMTRGLRLAATQHHIATRTPLRRFVRRILDSSYSQSVPTSNCSR